MASIPPELMFDDNSPMCVGQCNTNTKVKATYLTQFKYKKDKVKYEKMGLSQSAIDFYAWCLDNNRIIFTKIEH